MIGGLSIEYQMNDAATDSTVVERIRVAFERTGDELADFGKHVFPKLTPVFEAEAAKQFDAEGAGPSGGWAALSPAYAEAKARDYPGMPILQRTRSLYEALTDSSNAHAERVAEGEVFNYGTRGLEYPSFLQLGTDWMPARPPFDFSPDFEMDLAAAALEAASEAVADSGLDEFVQVVP